MTAGSKIAAATLLMLTACDESAELQPTLDDIQTHVFDEACATSGCHDASGVAGGLDLWDGASYGALVDELAENEVAAQNGWLRVKPGEPDRSFLIRKLELPGIGEGSPMPNGVTQLDPYYVNLIREWIAAGARP